MGIHLNACVFITWCCLQAMAVIINHHPVLEGTSTTLVCSGNATNSKSLHWQVEVGRNVPKYDAAYCEVATSKCYSHNASKYSAELFSDTDKCTSQLIIKNLSFNERGTVFTCSGLGSNSASQSWELSEVSIIPTSPTCRARTNDNRTVDISCHTSRVYPDLRCELTLAGRDVEMGTQKQFHRNHSYYSATCSYLVEGIPPGVHSFKVRMFPAFREVGNADATVVVDTNEVTIATDPYVKLTIHRLNTCTQEKVTCSAFWFLAAPNVTLYLGNTSATSVDYVSSSFLVDNATYRKFVWTYHVLESTLINTSTSKCVAVYREDNSSTPEVLIDETQSIHPAPPIFKYDNGQQIKANKVMVPNEDNIVLVCEAQEVDLHESSISITCESSSATSINKSTEPIVSINISLKSSNEWQCSCLAGHNSQCFTLVTNLTLFVSDRHHSSHRNENTTVQTVFIVFIAHICIIVGMIIAGLLIYYRKRIGLRRRRHVDGGSRRRPEHTCVRRGNRQRCPRCMASEEKQTDSLDHRLGVCYSDADSRRSVQAAGIRHGFSVNTANVKHGISVNTANGKHGISVNTANAKRDTSVNTNARHDYRVKIADVSHDHSVRTEHIRQDNLSPADVNKHDLSSNTSGGHHGSNLNTQFTSVNDVPIAMKPSLSCAFVDNTSWTGGCENTRYSEDNMRPRPGTPDGCISLPPPRLPPRKATFRSLKNIAATNTLATNKQNTYPPEDNMSLTKSSPQPCPVNHETLAQFLRPIPELPLPGLPIQQRKALLSCNCTSLRDGHDTRECSTHGPDFVIHPECDTIEVPDIPPRKPFLNLITNASENC